MSRNADIEVQAIQLNTAASSYLPFSPSLSPPLCFYSAEKCPEVSECWVKSFEVNTQWPISVKPFLKVFSLKCVTEEKQPVGCLQMWARKSRNSARCPRLVMLKRHGRFTGYWCFHDRSSRSVCADFQVFALSLVLTYRFQHKHVESRLISRIGSVPPPVHLSFSIWWPVQRSGRQSMLG